MNSFIIDGTEFGIDPQKSRLDFGRTERGQCEISLSIHGDHRTYQALTETENSEWSWTLYPPEFYLHGFPVPSEGPFSIPLTGEDCEAYDIALYVIEHNAVEDVRVSLSRSRQVEVRGKAELSGKLAEFAIRWEVEGSA